MFSWFTGSWEQEVNTADSFLTPKVITLFQHHDIQLTQPTGNTVVFENTESLCVYTIRICPVWDAKLNKIKKWVIQARQMSSGTKTSFRKWMKTFGVTTTTGDDQNSLTFLFPAIRERSKKTSQLESHQERVCIQTMPMNVGPKDDLTVQIFSFFANTLTRDVPKSPKVTPAQQQSEVAPLKLAAPPEAPPETPVEIVPTLIESVEIAPTLIESNLSMKKKSDCVV
jgi:hypothetical protein